MDNFQEKIGNISRQIFVICREICLNLQDLLGMWISTFWNYYVKQGKLNCWEKTASESLAVAGFVCDKAVVQAVVLRETTKRHQWRIV